MVGTKGLGFNLLILIPRSPLLLYEVYELKSSGIEILLVITILSICHTRSAGFLRGISNSNRNTTILATLPGSSCVLQITRAERYLGRPYLVARGQKGGGGQTSKPSHFDIKEN